MKYHVYIVLCADNTLYTGITTDVERRIHEHNTDNKKGARYTKTRRPVVLVYSKAFPDRATASTEEYRIKNLTRIQKLQHITTQTKKP